MSPRVPQTETTNRLTRRCSLIFHFEATKPRLLTFFCEATRSGPSRAAFRSSPSHPVRAASAVLDPGPCRNLSYGRLTCLWQARLNSGQAPIIRPIAQRVHQCIKRRCRLGTKGIHQWAKRRRPSSICSRLNNRCEASSDCLASRRSGLEAPRTSFDWSRLGL